MSLTKELAERLEWAGALVQATRLMEGLTADGQRHFQEANEVFETCTRIDQYPTIPLETALEAYFRRAQSAHYAGARDEAMIWIEKGQAFLQTKQALISVPVQAQCLLLEGVILEGKGDYRQAHEVYEEAWHLCAVGNHKLKTDVANRLARVWDHWAQSHKSPFESRTALQRAIMWIDMADEEINQASLNDPLVQHASASIKIRAGLYHDKASRRCLHQARSMLNAVLDQDAQAAFWRAKKEIAFSRGEFLRGSWFFVRFLWAGKYHFRR